MANEFQKATRKKVKLRLGLTGPSGSGKTYAALKIAKGLGGKIAAIDTENGSMSSYENMADFDVINMQAPYTPERMIQYIKMAEENGYDILIIDSITHEWSGPGGCIEINDNLTKTKFKGNSWSAWSETTPRHRKLLDTIIASGMHIIVTLRSKTETVQGENKRVIKLGMKSEQRDGFEYELTVVLDIIHEGHVACASKDRTGLFVDKDPEVITEQTGKDLLKWLNSGADPIPEKPEPKPQTIPPADTSPEAQNAMFAKAKAAIQSAKAASDIAGIRRNVKLRGEQSLLSDAHVMELLDLCTEVENSFAE